MGNQQQIDPRLAQARFNTMTRAGTLNLGTMSLPLNAAGTVNSLQLQPVGVCPGVWAFFTLSFTTTAFSGKTVAVSNKPAFDILPMFSQITLAAAGGTTFWQTSGQGAYLQDRMTFPTIDPRNLLTGSAATNNNAAVWFCPTTLVASTPYVITGYFWLPFAENPDWKNGLQNLNNVTNVINVNVTTGTINNCFTVSDASAVNLLIAGTPTLQVTFEQDYATLPPTPDAWPYMGYSQVVQEFLYSVNAQTWEIPIQPGPIYMKAVAEFYTSAGTRYTPANFSSIDVKYGGVNIPYHNLPQSLIIRDMLVRSGPVMPDGVIVNNWANVATGLLQQDSPRDFLSSVSLTQVSMKYNFASAPAAGDTCRLILTSLIKNATNG